MCRGRLMDSMMLATMLAAVAGGAGSEVGREAWAGLIRLVNLPFRHQRADDGSSGAGVSSGVAELADLAQSPRELSVATRLAEVLVIRADHDDAFRRALLTWSEQPALKPCGDSVSNAINGGCQNGPVLMGRDFHVPEGLFKIGQ